MNHKLEGMEKIPHNSSFFLLTYLPVHLHHFLNLTLLQSLFEGDTYQLSPFVDCVCFKYAFFVHNETYSISFKGRLPLPLRCINHKNPSFNRSFSICTVK